MRSAPCARQIGYLVSHADEVSLPSVFSDLELPALVLAEGDWHYHDKAPGIRSSVNQSRTPFRGSRGRVGHVAQLADTLWEMSVRSGRPTFGRPPEDPNLLRLTDWKVTGSRLVLSMQPTWYWSMLGTNMSIGRAVGLFNWNPGASEGRDPTVLRTSLLANPLTVNVCILSGDAIPQVLLQRRGRAVSLGKQTLQISAAGFVDVDDARGEAGAAWTAALREIQEETGIVVHCGLRPQDLRWVALCRTTGTYLPGLCGIIELSNVAGTLDPHPTKEAEEIDGYEWWDFTPEYILGTVKERGGWSAWVPLGAAALVSALVMRYGSAAVIAAWLRDENRE